MIKSNLNQLANIANPYQTTTRKVLAICSAGLLRSPTIASVFHKEYGDNVRCCGVSKEYALIPASTALLSWADLLVFAEQEHYEVVKQHIPINKKCQVLNIPDAHAYNSPALIAAIKTAIDENEVFEHNM